MSVRREPIPLYTGADFAWTFDVLKDGAAEDISAATSVEASLIDKDEAVELIDDTAQSNSGGANWSAGVVVVRFTAIQTAALTPGREAWIQLGVTLGGLRYIIGNYPVVIRKGFAL